jgi:poly-gamma-glutamate synthesis protein (capsule biosynthesis protein)
LATAWLLMGCGERQTDAPVVPVRVVLVAVGDILMHQDVQTVAARKGGFEPLWEEVIPLFQSADLVFGNLETPVAPLLGQPGEAYRFNAPDPLPGALKRSGFTLLSLANNHAYDQGVRGLQETLGRLEAAGLVPLGSGLDQSRAGASRILERNGLRIAFLAWTDLLNAHLNRVGKGPWVNTLEDDEAVEAVRAARLQADIVVVSLHWGREDRHDPSLRQRAVAARLIDAGADLILGHHPHVLQPLEVRETGGRRVAVAYSLGNFISNQDRVYDANRKGPGRGDERDGAALVATFSRYAASEAKLEKVGYIPLWTENNWREAKTPATPREIRVVRLDAPGRGSEPWAHRRERIRSIVGSTLEHPGGWGTTSSR